MEACVCLLSRHKNDPFLHRIVICDEEWILYNNRRRSNQWLVTIKQPRRATRNKPIPLRDNARQHTERITLSKLQEFQLETLCHPPYSPDLSLIGYNFFQILDNFLHGKIFKNQEEVKSAFIPFIDSHAPKFYSSGIDKLRLKWQDKCIDSMGAHYD